MDRPAQVRIRLLGGLAVEGLDERAVGSRKGRTVLKLLALARGAPVSVDRIADVVWGDDVPGRPGEQVGVLVSRLRGVLGADRLPRTDAGYALRCDWLDVDELHARVTEAERRHAAGNSAAARAAAESALALARGPLLPDENGEWLAAERSVAEQLVRRAEHVLAEAALAAGRHGTAVAVAESVLARDPYDETALRALMRAHVAAGRPASALAAYARAREQLADDLGSDPAPATDELHAAILRGEPVVPLPAASREPARLAGRDNELAAIAAALDARRPVAVEGEPGIGKSALLAVAAGAAAERGYAVVRCAADPLGNDLPLQPVLDALAAVLRERGPDAAGAVLGADAPVLSPLLGAGATAIATAGPTVLGDGQAGQARLFAALLGACERAAGGRPLLVVVDDVHRADAATAAWLSFAVRRGEQAVTLTAARPGGGRLAGAEVLRLPPLDVGAAAELLGDGVPVADLHARSGGNPLFLLELARSPDELPATIREAVAARADALGPEVAQTLKTAAALGPDVDLDLLAHVLDRPVVGLLADAEAAAAAALLAERGNGYGFASDVVREALAAGAPAARRAYVHREAARALAERAGADPRAVAWHARQGGDLALAATALAEAGTAAARRYDHDEAERLLADAVQLADGAAVRLARARTRLACWDVSGARADADRALELGAGPAGFEVRGWIAYYARDYAAAQRYADEGAALATDAAVRASCLALAGRTRHAQGDLAAAAPRLTEAAACAVPEIRGVAYVWLALLTAHEGRPEQARDLAERALLDPGRFAHPFARFHGEFARTLALGMQGRAHDVSVAAEQLASGAVRAGAQGARFVPIAQNLLAWPLRAVGRFGDAGDLLRDTVALTRDDATLAEPHYVAWLDLVDTLLAAGDLAGAARELDAAAAGIGGWTGTMAWRARQRLGLLRARIALATGDADAAEAAAAGVAAEAAGTGNARHAALAAALAAQASRRTPPDDVARVLAELDRCAAMEAWLVTAELAAAYGVDAWWADAERRAATLVEGAGPHAGDARRHVERVFAELRRRPR